MKCLLVTRWHLGSPLAPSALLPPSPARLSRLSRRSCSLCHSTAPCSGSSQRSVKGHRGTSEATTSMMQQLPHPKVPHSTLTLSCQRSGQGCYSLLLFSYGVSQFEIRCCSPISHWQQWWYLTGFLAASYTAKASRSLQHYSPGFAQMLCYTPTAPTPHQGEQTQHGKASKSLPTANPSDKTWQPAEQMVLEEVSVVLCPSGWACRCSCSTELARCLP